MVVHVSKIVTATVNGARLKQIHCEKCATDFHYQLARTGVGQAAAHYFLFQEAAKRRAQKRAQKILDKRLAKGELVPCPSCRWVNIDAIHAYRKSRYRDWAGLALIALFLGPVIDLVLYLTSDFIVGKAIPLTTPALWIIPLSALPVAALALIIRRVLRPLRINPNNLINGLPSVPPGTPPALAKATSETGEQILTPIPSEYSNLQTEATWATFRPGQFQLEPLCCQCLEPATTNYKLPITCEKPISVPLCQPCLRRIRNQWILKNIASILLAVAIAWLLSRLPSRINDVGRTMMWVFFAGFGALVGLLVIDKMIRPYRLRSIDKSRGIWKISFKNPAYTAILIRKIGQADGLYQPGDPR